MSILDFLNSLPTYAQWALVYPGCFGVSWTLVTIVALLVVPLGRTLPLAIAFHPLAFFLNPKDQEHVSRPSLLAVIVYMVLSPVLLQVCLLFWGTVGLVSLATRKKRAVAKQA